MRNFYPPMGGFPPYYQNMYPQYELPPIVEPSQFREES